MLLGNGRGTVATIEALRECAIENLKAATETLRPFAAPASYCKNAVSNIESAIGILDKIDIELIKERKRTRASTAAIFERPLSDAIEKIASKSYSALTYLDKMLSANDEATDVKSVRAVRIARSHLQKALRAMQKMKYPWLRIFLSGWVVLAIFGVAIIYAAVHFFFVGSGVQTPLSSGGTRQVAESLRANVIELKNVASQASDPITAITEMLRKITKLITVIPPLLAAIGVLWATAQKILNR